LERNTRSRRLRLRRTGGDIRTYLRLLRTLRPSHVELYHDAANDAVHLTYVLIAWVSRVPLVAVCRGGELLYWDQHRSNRKAVFWLGLKLARLVLYKELHMQSRLRALRIPDHRTFFCYNRVEVRADEPRPNLDRRGVLFLNSWRPLRCPDMALNVALTLAPRYPSIPFTIAGARTWTSEPFSIEEFEERVREAGLGGRVKILPWHSDVRGLFETHSVFLLPAHEVFLNYALLEAMERGLVPVIAAAPGAERVVDSGRTGFIVPLDLPEFVSAVDAILKDPELETEMCSAARRRVLEDFDLKCGSKELADLYQDLVWRS